MPAKYLTETVKDTVISRMPVDPLDYSLSFCFRFLQFILWKQHLQILSTRGKVLRGHTV